MAKGFAKGIAVLAIGLASCAGPVDHRFDNPKDSVLIRVDVKDTKEEVEKECGKNAVACAFRAEGRLVIRRPVNWKDSYAFEYAGHELWHLLGVNH